MNGPNSSSNESNSPIWPELWSAFETQRTKVRDILQAVSRNPSNTLSVWGAGRTTDLDLISLRRHYAKIELIDLDTALTEQALIQRGFDEQSNVTIAPATDVTGLDGHWKSFEDNPTETNLKAILQAIQKATLDLGRYDVVVSTCLLSQILKKVSRTLNESGLPSNVINENLPRVIRAIREKHLELIVEHTLPGGAAVLVTDLTSSEAPVSYTHLTLPTKA